MESNHLASRFVGFNIFRLMYVTSLTFHVFTLLRSHNPCLNVLKYKFQLCSSFYIQSGLRFSAYNFHICRLHVNDIRVLKAGIHYGENNGPLGELNTD